MPWGTDTADMDIRMVPGTPVRQKTTGRTEQEDHLRREAEGERDLLVKSCRDCPRPNQRPWFKSGGRRRGGGGHVGMFHGFVHRSPSLL